MDLPSPPVILLPASSFACDHPLYYPTHSLFPFFFWWRIAEQWSRSWSLLATQCVPSLRSSWLARDLQRQLGAVTWFLTCGMQCRTNPVAQPLSQPECRGPGTKQWEMRVALLWFQITSWREFLLSLSLGCAQWALEGSQLWFLSAMKSLPSESFWALCIALLKCGGGSSVPGRVVDLEKVAGSHRLGNPEGRLGASQISHSNKRQWK